MIGWLEGEVRQWWQRGARQGVLHWIPEAAAVMANVRRLLDKLLPRQRSSIKTLLAKLESGMGVEHSRHRSPLNAFVQVLSCRAV